MFGIRNVPALLLFRDGQAVEQVVGIFSRKKLEERLQAVLQKEETA